MATAKPKDAARRYYRYKSENGQISHWQHCQMILVNEVWYPCPRPEHAHLSMEIRVIPNDNYDRK
jgi:hypothetical protein